VLSQSAKDDADHKLEPRMIRKLQVEENEKIEKVDKSSRVTSRKRSKKKHVKK